ncbi:hypothetical protein [uncultured Pseudokineococcus sp.]|uniref:hypothetical protein n=1 Tax=uncultured Pseudokineococcus sp. TaxID=1642928 RepID=UPI002634C110|nr:hypothetical protein [uncultured Pseudokineococcus sp.]
MVTVNGESAEDGVAAVTGTHSGKGGGVVGTSATWQGVLGQSTSQAGVVGTSAEFVGVWGESHGAGHAGVFALGHKGPGVVAKSEDPRQAGVWGQGMAWTGVLGTSRDQAGVAGTSETFVGVWGEGRGPGHAGVLGIAKQWAGVVGKSEHPTSAGVWGQGTRWQGVLGTSEDQAGVVGTSRRFVGVWAETSVAGHAALYAKGADGRGLAGRFDGDVEVTGDIRLVNADGAELFDVAEGATGAGVEPGSVVVLDDDGALVPADAAYDRRVVGVVSGAGRYRPGLLLDHRPDDADEEVDGRTARRRPRLPVAVFGKVVCRVDATDEPVAVGDLLCSSALPGHAMRASDAARAFGAVIGKAMAPLAGGRGAIPILVSLQ